MKIHKLMTTEVRTCRPADSLSVAAQVMWEGDLGSLPVIDEARRVVGVVTDRDLCMSALMSGAPLWALSVGDAMAKIVFTVKPGDELREAARTMTRHQLRRLPVVDGDGVLVGLLTLGSLAQAGKSTFSPKDVANLLAAVTGPRPVPVSARMEVEVTRKSLPTQVLQPAPRKTTPPAAPAKAPKKAKATR